MDITDDHFKAIDEDSFNLFRTMPFLRYLSLASKINANSPLIIYTDNKFTIHGIHWLAKGIIQNRQQLFLKRCNFSNISLNNKGTKLLVHALSTCKLLTHLNLGYNEIDDSAIDDILLLIDRRKFKIKLKEFFLNNNRLTSVGLSKLLS